MRRRAVITSIGAAAALPVVARAQQAGRTYRLGFLSYGPDRAPTVVAVLEGLRAEGFVEGTNLAVDERGFGLRADQFETTARQMAQTKIDVLVCISGGTSVRGAQAATTTIPIVGIADDMVQEGLVGSLVNRSGNTTGISILAVELDGKRQEILMEMLPKARRMALLADAGVQTPAQLRTLQDLARSQGVDLSIQRAEKSEDILPALDAARAAGAEAINVLASPLLQTNRQAIFARARTLALPTIFQWPEGVADGALIAYGPGQLETFRQLGRLVAKVLHGAKPGELPVEQPTKFELVINLKIAKALGLTVPPTLRARADEVIE